MHAPSAPVGTRLHLLLHYAVPTPRNAEVIRQWQLLLAIERSRLGLTVEAMARLTGLGLPALP
jgi:hypothetical protein